MFCCVMLCGVVLRKVYFPTATHVLLIINAYVELSCSHTQLFWFFPKICLLSIWSYNACMIMYACAL